MQEWQLRSPNGYIQLVFISFNVEEQIQNTLVNGQWTRTCKDTGDWVEVSYGNYNEKFCGYSIPGPFTSTGPTMTVRMHSDGNRITGKGFQAVWLDTSPDFLWVGDNSVVDGSNWAPGFPVSG